MSTPVEKYRIQLEHDMYYQMVALLGAGSGHEFYKEMARPFVEIAERTLVEARKDWNKKIVDVFHDDGGTSTEVIPYESSKYFNDSYSLAQPYLWRSVPTFASDNTSGISAPGEEPHGNS